MSTTLMDKGFLALTELEIALERRCVKRIEKLGGLALKLQIRGVRGFPDRTVLLGRRVWFAEFKRPRSGRLSPQQVLWNKLLLQAGFETYYVRTDSDFTAALQHHKQGETT